MKKNRGVEKGACSSLDPCRCDSSVEDTRYVSEAESAEGQGLPCVSGLQLNLTLGREVLGVKKW